MSHQKNAIQVVVLVAGLVLYVYIYQGFLREIWDAPPNQPPNLDNMDLQIAAAVGGALGTAFAVALGIQRKGSHYQ